MRDEAEDKWTERAEGRARGQGRTSHNRLARRLAHRPEVLFASKWARLCRLVPLAVGRAQCAFVMPPAFVECLGESQRIGVAAAALLLRQISRALGDV